MLQRLYQYQGEALDVLSIDENCSKMKVLNLGALSTCKIEQRCYKFRLVSYSVVMHRYLASDQLEND